MTVNNTPVTLIPMQPLKYFRKVSKLDTFEYRVYGKPKLCVIACLKEYLCRQNSRKHAHSYSR